MAAIVVLLIFYFLNTGTRNRADYPAAGAPAASSIGAPAPAAT